jgi:hypothetical protein
MESVANSTAPKHKAKTMGFCKHRFNSKVAFVPLPEHTTLSEKSKKKHYQNKIALPSLFDPPCYTINTLLWLKTITPTG